MLDYGTVGCVMRLIEFCRSPLRSRDEDLNV